MTGKKLIFLILAISLGAAYTGKSGTPFRYGSDENAERRFGDGLRCFETADFSGAAHIFDSLRLLAQVHQRTTASYIMSAKANFRLGNYSRAIELLDSLEIRFPGTTYDDDIHYTEGISLLMEQRHKEAAGEFLHVAATSPDTALLIRSEALLNLIVRQRLSASELEDLSALVLREDLRDLLAVGLVARYRTNGDKASAEALLANRLSVPGSSPYRRELIRAKADLDRTVQIGIGVLFPFLTDDRSSGVSTIAREMLDGMNFAMKEYTAGLPSTTSITLELKDSGTDSASARTAFEELVENKKVIGVVGPLFSEMVAAVAPLSARLRTPVITPTATANGLTASSPYVFQLNPDFDVRGRLLARYAVRDRGYRNLAVFATSEPMGLSGKSFAEEAVRLGGTVVAQESFPADVQTLREQCTALRTAVLGSADRAEDLNDPVDLDAVYIAIDDPDEIATILSQLRFFNIHGVLLGNNEWYDRERLDAERAMPDTLLFVTDSYTDDRDSAVIAFRKNHREFTQRHASKYTFAGYDALRLVLDQLDPGIATGEELRKRLSAVRRFGGLHGEIILDGKRVNTHLHLMKYFRGGLNKIGDLSAP
ncbi:MAG TPA: ABC transporter substrate-binding protein [Bacteroidota bacterium]|nr:ABC transporter substrate-binding protein [Bacteroidota bacterium]